MSSCLILRQITLQSPIISWHTALSVTETVATVAPSVSVSPGVELSYVDDGVGRHNHLRPADHERRFDDASSVSTFGYRLDRRGATYFYDETRVDFD